MHTHTHIVQRPCIFKEDNVHKSMFNQILCHTVAAGDFLAGGAQS